MERHAGCREGGKGYPCRAIRTKEYLYIRNFDSDRWPAGSPERKHCVRHIRYGEVDPSPTKTVMMDDGKYAELADLAFAKRPEEELYLVSDDPYQLRNLADAKGFQKTRNLLRQQLDDHLKNSGDPRLTGKPALWDYYPFYRAPKFPGWKVAPMPAEFKKVQKENNENHYQTASFIHWIYCIWEAKCFVVMTDDQGYPEISAHGNPVLQTPNLDRLHGQSIRLSDYHVSPMCTPTRGQLLTGLDAARNGAVNVSSGRALLRPENPTMANYFADAGYSTGVFGKWHLGANYPYRPQDRGFQESVWYPSSSIPSVPAYWGNDYFDDVYVHNGKEKQFKGYCADVFFNEAKRFISESAEKKKPFMCYLATNTPHGPFWPKDEDRKAIAEVLADPKFDHLNGGLKNRLSLYLGMIRNIDWNMGKLMKFLDDEGLGGRHHFDFQNGQRQLAWASVFQCRDAGQEDRDLGGRTPRALLYPLAQWRPGETTRRRRSDPSPGRPAHLVGSLPNQAEERTQARRHESGSRSPGQEEGVE